jgi:hypothetical protein
MPEKSISSLVQDCISPPQTTFDSRARLLPSSAERERSTEHSFQNRRLQIRLLSVARRYDPSRYEGQVIVRCDAPYLRSEWLMNA